jgi:hypothetical protein
VESGREEDAVDTRTPTPAMSGLASNAPLLTSPRKGALRLIGRGDGKVQFGSMLKTDLQRSA